MKGPSKRTVNRYVAFLEFEGSLADGSAGEEHDDDEDGLLNDGKTEGEAAKEAAHVEPGIAVASDGDC